MSAVVELCLKMSLFFRQDTVYTAEKLMSIAISNSAQITTLEKTSSLNFTANLVTDLSTLFDSTIIRRKDMSKIKSMLLLVSNFE